MQNASVSAAIAFGKTRFSPEFIGSVDGGAQAHFAEWLDEGIGWAADRGGAAWRESFRQGGPMAFTYRPPGAKPKSSVLLGVMGPSEDSIGRPFPFCVLTEMREASYAAGGAALPIAAERFVAQACEVWTLTRSVSSSKTVLAEAAAIAAPRFGECAEAAQDMSDWSRQEGVLSRLWPPLFPTSGREGASRALRLLIDTVVPMRGRGGIATSRSIRVPLGNGGGAAAALWIQIVQTLADWTRSFPAVFWPADRAQGSAILCLGDVAAPVFGHLWGAQGRDPLLVDIARDLLTGDEDLPRRVVEIDRVLEEPKASLADLLGVLTRIGGSK